MKSELIVDVQPGDVSIALLEDSRLVSLQKEARNIAYAVGDIYLAKVKKLMPGLNAAFVNVGYEKDAFLHYLDLGSHFASYSAFVSQLLGDRTKVPALSKQKLLPDIDKHGTITDQLQPGRELLVQIVKEPISSKGPRLTTEITFTGRFLVLIPFSDKISISQKIKTTEEKLRLRQLVESIKPKNFGVIVRTSAEGKRVAELNHELKTLVQCWEDTVAKAQRAAVPSLIFEEESRIVGMLRDVFSPSFESITVNNPDIYSQIAKYVALIAPERKDIVKLYEKDEPIFDHFSITRQIKSSFGKTVSFKSGAYIIIEHTEALHVIDVNSGNRTKAGSDQETNALEVNLRAADEIARQLRLRDMGGIIVVDFIDMAKAEHRQELYDHMREIMANDRARHNILPLSKFGLMQITRQRVRPALDITTTETCPSCFGKGEVQPSLLFTDTLREKIDYLINVLQVKDFIVYVHPFVEAYIKRGIFSSLYGRWRRTMGRCFKIIADESLAYLQYRVIDKDHNEINLREEKDSGSSSTEKTKNKARNRGAEDPDELPVRPKAKQAKTEQKNEQKKQQPKAETAAQQQKAQTPENEQKTADNKPESDGLTTTCSESDSPKPAKKAKSKQRKPEKSAAPENPVTTETVRPAETSRPDTDDGIDTAENTENTDSQQDNAETKAKRPRNHRGRRSAAKKRQDGENTEADADSNAPIALLPPPADSDESPSEE